MRPCVQPGCPELVERGRCAKHQKSYQAETDANRVIPTSHYLTPSWKGKRRTILQANPYCACGPDCCPEGCQDMATEIDHIVGLQDGGTDDLSNLIGLSKRCHSRKSAKERHARGGW